MDNIIRRCSKELSYDRELINVILSREQWLALQHLCEDASCTPDINLHVVLLPCEHNLRRSVVSRGDISGHLGILDTRESEIANLQVAVLVYENVAGLEISVDDSCRVDIFQTPLGSKLALPHFLLFRGTLTKIWYRKYWMNCFSRGLEVKRRCKSVPRSSVTKYL